MGCFTPIPGFSLILFFLDFLVVTGYSYIMPQKKLLAKARNNPNGLRFRELETLLQQCGWTFQRQKGSHRYWYSPQKYRISIQPKDGKAKGYQVRQFLKRYDEEADDDA